jgi:branched-chain amino acid aminotransferase
MRSVEISLDVKAAIESFRAPEQLGFGLVNAPVMYSVEWAGGAWGRGRLTPYGPIELWPGARALQYAELVFEGMKAYRVGQARPSLFRPLDNCRRLAGSARRMAMPEVPEALFMEGIDAVADAMTPHVPGKSGQALYLRPFLFGTESGYLVRNSTTFRFMVIGNPVEAYATGPMRVAVERGDVRAAVGGLGDVKAAANYAGSLRASSAAMARGYNVALWLDASEHRLIQELSGMNLFAVIDGELHTPALDGAILPGITRDSLIKLAPRLGYAVRERSMPIDELLGQIADGTCSEIFASGTAAIVNAIGVLADRDGVEYAPSRVDHAAAEFREALLSIQERRAEDPFGWVREVPSHV